MYLTKKYIIFKMPDSYVPLTRAPSLAPVLDENVRHFYSEMLPNTNWSKVQISHICSFGQATEQTCKLAPSFKDTHK